MRQAIEQILRETKKLCQRGKTPILLAIDGRCAAGKTTLAKALCQECGCNVVHMDDFFLPPCERTAERMAQEGGNIDQERFLAQVLEPLKRMEAVIYRPYLCKEQMFGEELHLAPRQVCVIEGAYAAHPRFAHAYDLMIFMTADRDTQLRRIAQRNGPDGRKAFEEMWIPMEERYFSKYKIQEKCRITVTT